MSSEIIKKFVTGNHQNSNSDVIAEWNLMIKNGSMPSIDVQDWSHFGYAALHYHIKHDSDEAMEWLLSRRPQPNVNLTAFNNHTALYIAVMYNEPSKVRLLLDNGADRSISNGRGETPLDIARRSKYLDHKCIEDRSKIIRMLKSYYPDIAQTR